MKAIHSASVNGRLGGLLAGCLATLVVAAPAAAQEEVDLDTIVFEEIVVTAQKREQDIMEVPVAVAAVTGQQIEDAGIKDVFDLQQNVPGLIIGQSQTATTTNFSIRGIGSTSNNFGVESSVGLYVDGVYRSRQSSLINELIDVEAVEVLRGPQGTLFGKNTASGAIQVRTVRPSQDTDAFVDVTAGDYGLIRVSAAGNVSLSDNLALRATIFSSNRDGYVDDLYLGEELYNDRNRRGVRLQLALNDPADDFNMRIIADYSEIDEVCCVGVSRVDGLYSRASLPLFPNVVNGTDAVLVAFGGTVFTDYPYPPPFLDALTAPPPFGAGFPGTIVPGVGFDDYVVAYNDKPQSENEDMGISLELNKTFDNGMTFTSVSALRTFDTLDSIDGDFSDVDIFARINDVKIDSISQEFRLAGEFGDGGNYVAGVYYFGQEVKQLTQTPASPIFGAYFLTIQPQLVDIVNGVNAVSMATGGLIPPAADPFPVGTFATDDVVQDHTGWAAFGQIDFPLSNTFTLTLGGRYTDEEKDIDARYTQNAQGPRPNFAAVGLNLALAGMGQPFDPAALLPVAEPNSGWGSYTLAVLAPRPDLMESLQDDQFTGTAKLTWYATDTSMFYLSYGTGFKSGGTNTDRVEFGFPTLFTAEKSKSIEAGFKGDIGPVRMALTYHQTDYDDFQANSFTGTGFNVQNAGEIETDGYEVEAFWRPFDGFEAQLIYTHTEGEYVSFEEGTAWDATPFHTLQPDPNCGGDFNANVCPRTGGKIAYNPEDRLFLAVTQEIGLTNSTSMFVRGEFTRASEQFTDGDLDPFTLQDDFEVVNLRVGFNFEDANSTLTFWGRNITDERYYVGSFDPPIQAGRMNSYPAEPSTWGITFRKSFY